MAVHTKQKTGYDRIDELLIDLYKQRIPAEERMRQLLDEVGLDGHSENILKQGIPEDVRIKLVPEDKFLESIPDKRLVKRIPSEVIKRELEKRNDA